MVILKVLGTLLFELPVHNGLLAICAKAYH